jgi:hypothetical protein
VIDFARLENFPATGGFSGAENRKNEAVFREFFETVILDEIFYVTKVVRKILRGVFLINRRFMKKSLEKNYFPPFFLTFCEKPLPLKIPVFRFFKILMKI